MPSWVTDPLPLTLLENVMLSAAVDGEISVVGDIAGNRTGGSTVADLQRPAGNRGAASVRYSYRSA